MRPILICLLFLFHLVSIHAQRSPNEKEAVVDSLLKQAHSAYNDIDLLSSMESALEANSISEDINYSEGIARSNFYIAQVLSSVSDYDQSLEYLSLAEKEKYTARDPFFYSEVTRLQGRVLSLLGLHQSSVHVFKKGIHLIHRAKESNETDYLLSMAYKNLSHVYGMLNESDSSIHYMELNRELLESLDEKVVYRNLINLHGQHGREFTKRKEYDSAAYYLDAALILADKYQFPYTAYIHRMQGEMEISKGNIPAALDHYYKGIANTKETGIQRGLITLYQAVSEAYSRLGNPDSSRHYIDMKMELEEELSTTNVNALDNAVQALLENERQQQSTQFRSTLLLVGIIAAVVLLAALAWWLNRVKKHKKFLLEKENEIEGLQKKVSDATKEVIELAKNNDDSFLIRFNELYPQFSRNLFQQHPDLIQSEYAFCVLIFLHFNSKEIAQILFVEHRSVQTRKNRLRKKLKLPSNTDLYQYLITMEEEVA